MGLADKVNEMQGARATNTPAAGDAAAAVAEALDTAGAPAPSPAPAAEAAAPPAAETPAPAAETPAAAAASAPAGDGTTKPADADLTPEEKRVKDAQAKMHTATTDAAQAKAQLSEALQQNTQLKERLTTIFNEPSFAELAVPSDLPTDEAFRGELRTALDTYHATSPDVDDKTATWNYEVAKADILQRWDDARRTRSEVVRENSRRAIATKSLVKQSIENLVASIEPNLHLEWFWTTARSAEVTNATPAEITDPVARVEWQAKYALQLCQQRLGKVVDKTRDIVTQDNANTRAAQAVMPGGGSAAPAPAPAANGNGTKSRSLTDMVSNLPAQVPAGATRR